MNLDDFNNPMEAFGLKTSNEESLDLSEYEKFGLNEIDGASQIEFTGKPTIIRFDPEEDSTYATARLQLMNDKDKQLLNIYCNLPLSYPVIRKIYATNDFYKNTYNLINTIVSKLNSAAMVDGDGNPVKCIDEFNLEPFMEFINGLKTMTVKVIENGDSGYNTFVVKSFK